MLYASDLCYGTENGVEDISTQKASYIDQNQSDTASRFGLTAGPRGSPVGRAGLIGIHGKASDVCKNKKCNQILRRERA
jgi:hypothetical protein